MSAIVEQLPYGFRYRVTRGAVLHAASPVYDGLDSALYALAARFPGLKVSKIEVCE